MMLSLSLQVYGSLREWWSEKTVADLKLATPITVSPDLSVGECASLLKSQSFDQVSDISLSLSLDGLIDICLMVMIDI